MLRSVSLRKHHKRTLSGSSSGVRLRFSLTTYFMLY